MRRRIAKYVAIVSSNEEENFIHNEAYARVMLWNAARVLKISCQEILSDSSFLNYIRSTYLFMIYIPIFYITRLYVQSILLVPFKYVRILGI